MTLGRLLLVVSLALPASAFAADRDPVKADELFRAGIELLKKDDWQTACPKFEESMALDPSVGAAINIARCQDRAGKIATALQGFRDARALNRNAAGEALNPQADQFINESIARLEPRLPKLVVSAPGAPADLSITRDGAPFTALDKELPSDPGRSRFVATATGYERLEIESEVLEGKTNRVVLELKPAGSRVAPPQVPPRPPPESGGFGTQGIAGFAIGGVGAASLIVSAITGGVAFGEASSIDESCTTEPGCGGDLYKEASDAHESSKTLALVSTVTMFAGIALAGTGLILVLTEPAPRAEAAFLVPWIGPDVAGIAIGGTL
ncbi:MAG: hypothetical protein JNK04_09460 [Myxococcales bacterium]|nr:hypothetical protein [Myxococcales bacterium]